MASPVKPVAKPLDAPPPMLVLYDDLLTSIFLLLPILADVRRAATVCSASAASSPAARSSAASGLRSVHRAPCLGFIHDQFLPVEAPHPSVPSLARADDFSFLPSASAGHWFIQDVRDGRVLLQKSLVAGELAVADTVSRRYVLLPAPPVSNDLAALVQQKQSRVHLESFLVPASDDDEPTSFRVICIAVCRAHLVAFVFSSVSEDWGAFPFKIGALYSPGTRAHSSASDDIHGATAWTAACTGGWLEYLDQPVACCA